ncbi:large subunit terminase [Vibrio phage douglas 12A4]|uniref:large subunit terminase n=1 Tax=Vibrio phage douglas 12A4 TaxID=573171 RepID=UPI0002C121BE|nr:large subunit terminase [Vibrio phage douglas 12A4]AGG58046.1 large subunit terminase [Vibrio phage douglas 12A4]
MLDSINSLNDEEFNALPRAEKRRFIKLVVKNPWWRMENLYKIQDENGDKVTFKLRPPQRQLFKNMHSRNIILKARQLGFSTAIEIYLLDHALFNKERRCGVVAQDLKSAGGLFSTKILYPYENLPGWLKSRIRVKSLTKPSLTQGGRIQFNNGSQISCSNSFRSDTIHFLHLSEHGKLCAKSPDKAYEVKTGTFPTLHKKAILFDESTAEGVGGDFYTYCKRAEELMHSGEPLQTTDMKFFFFSWWQDAKYSQPVPLAGLKMSKYHLKYFEALERVIGITLTDEQKNWYIQKEIEQGDKMKQEYPSTPDEAFLTSGRRVFDAISMMKVHGRCSKPLIVYDVNPNTGDFTKVTNNVKREGEETEIQKGLMGYLLVWELPEDDADYAIGADVAEGLAHGDRSVFDVCDSKGRQVAHWYGHLDTKLFARLLAHVGKFYNNAYMGPERNNHGHAVINELRDVYPIARIYTEEHHDRDDEHEETAKIGWLTTKKSKPIAIEGLKEGIRTDTDGIRWIGTVSEMNTYVYDDKGSTNAQVGCFDDQVMSYAIAQEMVARMPRTIRKDNSYERQGDWRAR